MTFPNPSVAWLQTAYQNFPLASAIAVIIADIKTMIDALTYWETKTGGTGNYIEIGPVAGAPAGVLNMRIIIAGGTAPFTLNDRTNTTTVNLMANFCTDITNRTEAAADWTTVDPFAGADGVATGFVPCTKAYSLYDRLYAVESEEMICINFRIGTGDDSWPYFAGAMISPLVAGGGDATDRIFGACWQGDTAKMGLSSVTAAVSSTSGASFGKVTGSTKDRAYFMFQDPSTGLMTYGGLLQLPYTGWFTGTPGDPEAIGDYNDNLALIPQIFVRSVVPVRAIGYLRGIYPGFNQAANRTVLQNTTPIDVAFVLAPSDVANQESWLLADG